MVAEESGGTISTSGSGGNGNSGGSGSSGSSSNINGRIVGIDETKGFYLSNGSDNAFFNYGDGVLNHVADFLKGSPAAGLAYKFAFNSVQGNQRIEASYQAGVSRGIHNYNTGRTNLIANMKGFNSDYMTEADWQGIVANKTNQWGRELQSDVLDIVATPLILLGGGYAGMRLIGSGLKTAAMSFTNRAAGYGTKLVLNGASRAAIGAQVISSSGNFAYNSLSGSNDFIQDAYRFYQGLPTGDHRGTFSAELGGFETKVTYKATDMDFAVGFKYKGFENELAGGFENTSVRLTWNDGLVPSFDVIHEFDRFKPISSPRFELKTGTRTVVNQTDLSPRLSASGKLKLGQPFGLFNLSLGYDGRY